jgi:molybdopterin-guanine dinucleotide biosynthesis protein A
VSAADKYSHQALDTDELRKRLYSRYAGEPADAWLLVAGDRLKALESLLFAYEAVLTEMRTYAKAGDRTIAGWVKRLDFERDENAKDIPMIQERKGG